MQRRKVAVFLTLIVCGSAVAVRANDFPYAEAVMFLGTEAIASNLVKAVCAVQLAGDKPDTWIPIGSGFFILSTNNVLLGVTCKHVVDLAGRAKKDIYVGVDTVGGYRRFLSNLVYVDPTNDIAILEPQHRSDEKVDVKNIVFPLEAFDEGSSVVEGRGVLITGYPLALGVEDDKNHPVVRFGMIAQNTGKSVFLIDGVASHGNSGSPVFTLKYNENKLVGMITSVVSDSITLLGENGELTAALPYNAGIARAVRASLILKALKEAEKKL